MCKIILINGVGRSGKDLFVKLCQTHCKNVHNISTVDKVKESATILGWNGQKDEKSRKFLSDLKDLAENYSSHSENYIKDYINNLNEDEIVFVHVREPQQLTTLSKKFNAKTLLVRNNRVKQITTNHADSEVENFNYDFIIENNGTIEEYEQIAKEFICVRAMWF